MKILIAYFSLSGNTEWLAKEIGNQIETVDCHQIELADPNPAKGNWAVFWYGFKTIFNQSMNIKSDNLDLSEYDLVLIGMPIWTDNVPPPIRAFLNKHHSELSMVSVGIFATYGGDYKKFFENVKQRLPNLTIKGTLAIPTTDGEWKNHVIGQILDFLTEVLKKNIWISSH